MPWIIQFSGFLSAALLTIILSHSLKSFPPAEAIRSTTPNFLHKLSFKSAPLFQNQPNCHIASADVCNPSLIHVAITLDINYLRGSIAAVHSILQHSTCPDNIFFHIIVSQPEDNSNLIKSLFPNINFKIYHFNTHIVQHLISSSIRHALEEPLNYARNYLAHILPSCVRRVIYLDSDVIIVDDINKLYTTFLGPHAIGVPEYCHANFTKYFTNHFWSDPSLSATFSGRVPCYFNTGVMVIDLIKWRVNGYTRKLEEWMEIQRAERIYELGSLPPFLLVFAGHVAGIEHRWNQHGLGGDNVRGSCRDLHPGPVSLLHWSGSGKPWARLDAGRACPLDLLWAPYDLYVHTTRGEI